MKSRNEFLNQILKFYIGYLTFEKIVNYMFSTISLVMHSTVRNKSVAHFRLWGYDAIRLFKCCVTICFRVFFVGIIIIKAR